MAAILTGKFVYLATPHTASIATTRALCQLPDVVVSNIWEVSLLKPERTLPGPEFHHTHTALREAFPEHFDGNEVAVATVRHPCDLLVTWWLRARETILQRYKKNISFAEFVKTCDEETPGPYLRQGKMFWHDATRFLRYERLQEDLNEFLSEFGLPTVGLDRANVTKDKRPWPTYYTADILRVVERRFGAEARQFGYDLTTPLPRSDGEK